MDTRPRLRAPALERPLHLVLVEPEIPPNTGNIARLAAATSSTLHLVGRLGFRVDDHAVRRAGLDYWHLVDLQRHASVDELAAHVPPERWILFSARSGKSYLEAPFEPGSALVFGSESRGLPDALLDAHPDRTYAIPTLGAVRSLNLSNAVSIVVYEALRRLGALDAPFLDP